MRARFGCNAHDDTYTAKQWGGTGIVSYGRMSFYSMGAGTDKLGLGRWTWARYRGKGGVVLRVVSIYQPCKNKYGAQSVYAQHKNYLQTKNDDRDPRTAFREDLKSELENWIEEGDQIIVGGDVNESVFHPDIQDIFQTFQMRNIIFDLHGANNAPTTYYRTTSGRIVDGIWTTPGISARRGGFLEPGDFPGDHSLLWIDVTYDSALGHNPPHPVSPQARRLQLGYSRVTKRYLDRYEKLVDEHKLDQRSFVLENSTQYGQSLTGAQRHEAEAIDFMRTKFMNMAEKRCRKLKMGMVDFSPAVAQPLRELAFWDIAIRRRYPKEWKDKRGRTKKQKGVSSKLWRRKKAAAKITEKTGHLSKEQMERKRRKAKRAYLKAKKKHKALRRGFLDTLPPKDRERLKRHERQRHLGRCAKAVTGKLESKSVSKVEHDGQEMTTQKDIETVLLEVNRAKTRASDSTTFLQQPMLSEFGRRNETESAQQVLDGVYNPPDGTSNACRKLLHNLRTPHNIRIKRTKFQPRRRITTDDHIRAFRKAKERTSAGMSNLHFGMFKAHTKRRKLAEFDATLRSIAYTTGYSFKRWKRGLDVQLLKRAKQWAATKLRTILLLEADFNMNNKALGADAMRMGEANQCLARDNYGGRKDMQAAEVSMNSQLTYDSIWARRGRAIIMSNDAKGCYDRIAHVVVDMALRRLGVPKPALQSMIETIQEMEHHIRTAFGDSEGHYGNDNHLPPQGILQGNGAGPAGWFAISTVLIQILKDEGYGYKEWTLIKQRAISITCFAFVDDTDLIHANNDREVPTERLIDEAQSALTLWENLLSCTGGALAPEKSYWYLVNVIPKDGKWTYATAEDNPGQLRLNNGTHVVRRQEVDQSNEALGIQIRPDRSMENQKQYLIDKVQYWCDAIRTKKMQGQEAWYCLTTTISKTIEYSLVATTFSREDIDAIMQPLFKAALRLCGLQRNMPRKLVYGPLEARGCGLKDPFYMQLILHITSILKHQHRDTPSRDLHQENMELLQFYIGSDQNFWDLPFPQYGILAPDGWMKNTWQSLWSTNLSLKGPSLALPTQRTRDVHLMDAFIQSAEIQPADIPVLQKCRLHVRATRLSDITTAEGGHLNQACWEGAPSSDRTPRQWIPTIAPTYTEIATWQQALRLVFLAPYTQTRRLRRPLGNWKHPHDEEWLWWKDLPTDTLYQREGGEWNKWQRRQALGNYAKYDNPIPSDPPPPTAIRASVNLDVLHNMATVRSTGIASPPTVRQTPTTVTAVLNRLPDNASWATKSVTITGSEIQLAQAIQNGTAVAVSDGSLKHEFGTSAYVVEASATCRLRAVNTVPGPIKEGDSHRCELAGLYGLVICCQALCTAHNIQSGRIQVACDNINAIEVFEPEFFPHPKQANYDLVSALFHKIKASPIEWLPEHVKGHQDDQTCHTLTHKEQLNIEMDKLAKTYWVHIIQHSRRLPLPSQFEIEDEGWQLWSNDTKLVSPRTNLIYNAIHIPVTQSWWRRHGHVSIPNTNNIDWRATATTMRSLPHAHRQWITKTASQNCGVGTTLVNWKYQDDAKCPRCGHPEETTEHVSICHGRDANKVFRRSHKRLRRVLRKEDTDPRIQRALLSSLKRWRKSEPFPTTADPDIQQAITQQTEIGWQALLEGLPSHKWAQLQQSYYSAKGSRRKGSRWMVTVLRALVRMGRRQWLHRNDVKHHTLKPRHEECRHLLHHQIIREYAEGPRALLPGDKRMLKVNLIQLLRKPLAYKKAWWANIIKAKQRKDRLRLQREAHKRESQENSKLFQYMQGRIR